MMTIRVIEPKNAIEIMCDKAGIATLLEQIALLTHHRSHIHLRGPSKGGTELAKKSEVTEVTVYYCH